MFKCKKCGRGFEKERGLQTHERRVHGTAKKKTKKRKAAKRPKGKVICLPIILRIPIEFGEIEISQE